MKDGTQAGLFGPALTLESRTVSVQSIVGLEGLFPGNAAHSIQSLGLLQDPLLQELEEDGYGSPRYRVISGEGRVCAIRDLGQEELSAKVIPYESNPSHGAVAAAQIVSNLNRRRNYVSEATALQEAINYYTAQKREQGDQRQDEVIAEEALTTFASAFGVKVSKLKQIYRILKLPKMLIDAGLEQEIAGTTLVKLAGESFAIQEVALNHFKTTGSLSGAELYELKLASEQEAANDLAEDNPELFPAYQEAEAQDGESFVDRDSPVPGQIEEAQVNGSDVPAVINSVANPIEAVGFDPASEGSLSGGELHEQTVQSHNFYGEPEALNLGNFYDEMENFNLDQLVDLLGEVLMFYFEKGGRVVTAREIVQRNYRLVRDGGENKNG